MSNYNAHLARQTISGKIECYQIRKQIETSGNSPTQFVIFHGQGGQSGTSIVRQLSGQIIVRIIQNCDER